MYMKISCRLDAFPRMCHFIGFVLLSSASAAVSAPSEKAAGWGIAQSVGYRRFVGFQGASLVAYPEQSKDYVSFSPDGRYFYAVSRRGDLQKDANIYELIVFDSAAVRKAIAEKARPRPLRVVAMSDGLDAEGYPRPFGISQAKWGAGSSWIDFLGSGSGVGPRQVYRLNVRSGKLSTISATKPPFDIDQDDAKGDGHLLVESYLAPVAAEYPYYRLDAKRISNYITYNAQIKRSVSRTRAYFNGTGWWDLDAQHLLMPVLDALSPDGRHALLIEGVEKSSLKKVLVADLKTKTLKPLKSEETGAQVFSDDSRPVGAYWSPDSRYVVVSNAVVDSGHPEQESLLIYDALEGRPARRLRRMSGIEKDGHQVALGDVAWDPQRLSFQVARADLHDLVNLDSLVFSRNDVKWVPSYRVNPSARLGGLPFMRPGLAQSVAGLSIRVVQSDREPPKLVAFYEGRQVSLLAPDPALQNVKIIEPAQFSWPDSTGELQTGTLLMPSRNAAAKLPLVIQLTRTPADEFQPDGDADTGFAAQALAAQGIAVLNLTAPYFTPAYQGKPFDIEQIRRLQDWIDTAVSKLKADRGIDEDRVGLIGFSFTGLLVNYILIQPTNTKFAAAEVADSYSGSLNQMLTNIAIGSYPDKTVLYGGNFPAAKGTWFEREISLNLDKVSTPILYTANSERIFWTFDIVGALTAARRPFDYLTFPKGTHELTRPRQREAGLEVTVDWMRYWLKDEKSAGAEKAAQFERWNQLKTNWQTQRLWEAAGNPVGSVPGPGFNRPQ